MEFDSFEPSFTSIADELVDKAQELIEIADSERIHDDSTAKVRASHSAPAYIKHLVKNELDSDEDEKITTTTSTTSPFDSANTMSFEELQIFRRRLTDEDRLSNMYKLRHSFTSRFDNRAWIHPHGTTNFDYKAISKRHQEQVEKYKNRVRKENYMYLGSHPEIQAIISIILKRLLSTQPDDAAEHIVEFFATRLTDTIGFEDQIKEEMKRVSRYHVTKLKNAGKINIRASGDVISEASGQEYLPELDANYLKKLNIGALAVDFAYDPCCLMSAKKKAEEEKGKRRVKKKHKKHRPYCGCKDWKLKKNKPDSKTSIVEPTSTTLGNVDTLRTSEEEETEEEEEDEFGEDLDPEVAERIASQLVQDFLGMDEEVYMGQNTSFGSIPKNIQ